MDVRCSERTQYAAAGVSSFGGPLVLDTSGGRRARSGASHAFERSVELSWGRGAESRVKGELASRVVVGENDIDFFMSVCFSTCFMDPVEL